VEASGGAVDLDPAALGQRVGSVVASMDLGPYSVPATVLAWVISRGYVNIGRADGPHTGYNNRVAVYTSAVIQSITGGIVTSAGIELAGPVIADAAFWGQPLIVPAGFATALIAPGALIRVTGQQLADAQVSGGAYYHRFGNCRIMAAAFRTPGS
jgi:hypothetical protein